MEDQAIKTAFDVYELVDGLKTELNKNGFTDLAAELDDAMHLGSSGLEILGAIRNIFVEHRADIVKLLGPRGESEVNSVVSFVDSSFGL